MARFASDYRTVWHFLALHLPPHKIFLFVPSCSATLKCIFLQSKLHLCAVLLLQWSELKIKDVLRLILSLTVMLVAVRDVEGSVIVALSYVSITSINMLFA